MTPVIGSFPAEHPPAVRLFGVLDRWALRLGRGGEGMPPMNPVLGALDRYRAAVPPEEWHDTVVRLRAHPICGYLYEDPYTSWGFRKPRGYPGDAVLLDFIYGGGASAALVEDASPMGRAIYHELMEHPASASLRGRREFLRARLARILGSVPDPRILAVACGHLREADSFNQGSAKPARFVALDQDAESLRIAQANHPDMAIEPLCDSVLSLVRGRDPGVFDYIYSAGLYDYLSDNFACRLTVKLAGMLAPGGTLLIANVMPRLPGAGYMEAVMDWWLIYRTAAELRKVSSSLGDQYKIRPFARRYVAYLEITR